MKPTEGLGFIYFFFNIIIKNIEYIEKSNYSTNKNGQNDGD